MREMNFNLLPTPFIHKAIAHTNVRIGILHIRLYIINWSTVNKVGACNNKRAILHAKQTHRR